MMNVMPGGIRLPSAPPAAREPRTIFGSYRVPLKNGSATEPIVAAVATEEPEIAENTPDAAMLVWRSPPGMRSSHTFSER
jgi:hypothetical protein